MGSKITTSKIDINYPVPGINNNSQGFRNNFASIKNNFDLASAELSDLQNKAIVKSALNGIVIDNNMNDTVISKAVTRSFRASTYNLGNDLSGVVRIDVTAGDVQYGTLADDTSFEFTGWADAGLQSSVKLQLAVASPDIVMSFPSAVDATLLENYVPIGGTPSTMVPSNTTVVCYEFSTIDCGISILANQYNRSVKSTQLQLTTGNPLGNPGDRAGAIGTEESIPEVTITVAAAGTNQLTCSDTSHLSLDMPVIFSGNVFGNLQANVVYYIKSILGPTIFTLSSTPGTVSGPGTEQYVTTSTGSMKMTSAPYIFVATAEYDAVPYYHSASATAMTVNTVTLDTTNDLHVNDPIVFSNAALGNIELDKTYYIASIVDSTRITISERRFFGKAAQIKPMIDSTSANTQVVSYQGTSIWKKIPLQSW